MPLDEVLDAISKLHSEIPQDDASILTAYPLTFEFPQKTSEKLLIRALYRLMLVNGILNSFDRIKRYSSAAFRNKRYWRTTLPV